MSTLSSNDPPLFTNSSVSMSPSPTSSSSSSSSSSSTPASIPPPPPSISAAILNRWKELDSRPVPDWFDDAKFGIFIHWGVYSVPAWAPVGTYAEWYWYHQKLSGTPTSAFHSSVYPNLSYPQLADRFTAELYDPMAWARLFQKSGARYVIPTSKHHDGYTLWPSAQSPGWNAVEVGPCRDVLGELVQAVREVTREDESKPMQIGMYYSLFEFFHPWYVHPPSHSTSSSSSSSSSSSVTTSSYATSAQADDSIFSVAAAHPFPTKPVSASPPHDYINRIMLPQMKDLIERYEPAIFWPDGEWQYTSEQWCSTEFLTWLYEWDKRKEQEAAKHQRTHVNVVVNDRWGKDCAEKHGGFYTAEYTSTVNAHHKWELSRGMDIHSYGYNRQTPADKYVTPTQLIHLLIRCVANNGNFLVDIGPRADGMIPVLMQERLLQMGDWLSVNGESIYATRAFRQTFEGDGQLDNTTVRYTRSKNVVTVSTTSTSTASSPLPCYEAVYAHVLVWPTEGVVRLRVPIVTSSTVITLLGEEEAGPLNYVMEADGDGDGDGDGSGEGGLMVQLPVLNPSTTKTKYAWVLKLTNTC